MRRSCWCGGGVSPSHAGNVCELPCEGGTPSPHHRRLRRLCGALQAPWWVVGRLTASCAHFVRLQAVMDMSPFGRRMPPAAARHSHFSRSHSGRSSSIFATMRFCSASGGRGIHIFVSSFWFIFGIFTLLDIAFII